MRPALFAALLLALALFADRAFAQSPEFSVTNYHAGDYPGAAAIADLNGDGLPDLAVVVRFPSAAQVLLATAPATYTLGTSIGSAVTATAVAFGHFDTDAFCDLVLTDIHDYARIYSGDGHGGFALTGTFTVGDEPDCVAAADLNGDGIDDIVTANSLQWTATVLLSSASGGFSVAATLAVGKYPYALALNDVNGDGNVDIVTSNYGTGDVTVVLGDGHGGFGTPHAFPVGASPERLALGDLNGDGVPDVVVTHEGTVAPPTLSIGDGVGGFGPPTTISAPQAKYGLAIADFNRDGANDLLFLHGGQNVAVLCLGDGHAHFAAPVNIWLGYLPSEVRVTDLNGDGYPDFVVSDTNKGYLSVGVNITGSQPTNYCTAKANSLACVPKIAATGFASASNPSPCVISASDVINHKLGVLIYGHSSSATPFEGGYLCVEPPFTRTVLTGSAGSSPPVEDCTGRFRVDFNALIQSGQDPTLVPDAEIYAQFWYRDLQDSSGFGTGLTDAVQFRIVP